MSFSIPGWISWPKDDPRLTGLNGNGPTYPPLAEVLEGVKSGGQEDICTVNHTTTYIIIHDVYTNLHMYSCLLHLKHM